MSVVYWIIGAILKVFLTLESWLLGVVAELFQFFIQGTNRNIATFDAVQIGWVTVRDILNMFFILFLLVIAFATILRVENYQYKRLLPRLIISVLLVNFSRTICAFFIEISDLMMRTFTVGYGGRNLVSVLTTNLGLDKLATINNTLTSKISDPNITAGLFMLVVLVGVFILALSAVVILLISRMVALMFLTILSPAAFVLDVLPATQEYARKWWSEFLKFIIYGPVATFFIYIAVVTSNTLKTSSGGAFANLSSNNALSVKNKGLQAWLWPSNQFDLDHFLRYALVIAMLFGTVVLVRGIGSFGAAAAMGAVTAGLSKGVGMYGRFWRGAGNRALGLGRGAAGLGRAALGNQLALGNQGILGRALGSVVGGVGYGINRLRGLDAADAGQRRQDLAERSGNWTRFASPTLMKDAFGNIGTELQNRAKRGAAGYVEDSMGSLFGMTSDSYQQDINAGIQEEMKNIQTRHPSLSPQALIGEVKSALNPSGLPGFKSANLNQAQAAYQHLINTNMLDQLFAAAQNDEQLRNTLFGEGYEGSDHFQRNGYKNNVANRMRTMKNLFGEDMALRIADNYGGSMIGQGAYDWVGMVGYKDGQRIWTGDDKVQDWKAQGLSDGDIELMREKSVAGLGAKIASGKSSRDRANVANSTTFTMGGSGEFELGRHEMERAVQGFHSAQDNARQWQEMGARKKVESRRENIKKQRANNAAASMLLNYTYDGKTVGSNTYSKANGINGASWELTVNAGVDGLNNSQIQGQYKADFKSEVSKLVSSSSGQAQLKKMLREVDPAHFSNDANLNKAIADMTAKVGTADFDGYFNQVFDTVMTERVTRTSTS